MKQTILISIVVLFSSIMNGQSTAEFDSLYIIAVNSTTDSAKSYNYETAVRGIIRFNTDSAIAIANLALNYAQKIPDSVLISDAYNSLGTCYKQISNFNEANKCLRLSINYASKGSIQEERAKSLLGLNYWEQGQYSIALEIFYEILLLEKNRKDTSALARTYNNIANIYFEQDLLDKARDNYEEAYQLAIVLQSKFGQCLLLNNLGSVYYKQEKLDLALEYFQKSYELSVELEDTEGIGISYVNFASLFNKQKKFDKALEYHKKALEIKKQLSDRAGESLTMNEIGKDYEALGFREKGIFYCKGALNLAREIGALELERSANEALYKMYDAKGDELNAYEYYKNHIQLRDSITNEESKSKDLRSELNFEFKKQLFADSLEQLRKEEVAFQEIEKEKVKTDAQKKMTYIFIFAFVLMLILSGFIFKEYKEKKKSHEVISKQKKEVEIQSLIIKEKNKEITDSIKYAKRIQSAILPPQKLVKQYLHESFILYKPKDIVAGDFYWMEHKDGKVLFAAADCTGHGVPGAMVSVICNNGLNRSVRENGLTDPGEILNQTRETVVKEFEKSEEEVKDGMDIALCVLDGDKLQYAGAHNPLWIIRNKKLIEIKADKQPIGKFEHSKPFVTHNVDLEKGDSIYIFSDGFVDQFGGEKGKKFKVKTFRELLLSIQDMKMDEQRNYIDEIFEKWRGDLEQVDDVCVIGVRI